MFNQVAVYCADEKESPKHSLQEAIQLNKHVESGVLLMEILSQESGIQELEIMTPTIVIDK